MQYRILHIEDDGSEREQIVGVMDDLEKQVAEAAELGEYRVEGRSRLNDYVGSPIWSKWEVVEDERWTPER